MTPKWNFARWQRAVFDAVASHRITPGAALTGLALETYADHGTGANAHPGLERLMRDVRAGESTVRRHLGELGAAGLIVLVRRGGGRNRLASVFQMTIPNSAHQRAENDGNPPPGVPEDSGSPGPNSAHQQAENTNSAHYSAHYSAHDRGATTLTTKTTLAKTGTDPRRENGDGAGEVQDRQSTADRKPKSAPREDQCSSVFADAVSKLLMGEFDSFETNESGWQYGEIPRRFYVDGDSDSQHAAARLLWAAVKAVEATGRVTDGLAYLCTPEALRMDDAPFLVRIVCAEKDPHSFTKTTADFTTAGSA